MRTCSTSQRSGRSWNRRVTRGSCTMDEMDLSLPRYEGRIHPAYANPRPEVTAVVPGWAKRVLDVGCSVGMMGDALQMRGHVVTGIEYETELADEARKRLHTVFHADVEGLARDKADVGGPFDCVCFADV